VGEQLQVHPPGLRRSGRSLQDVAERVASAWQDLQNTVHGMGEIFGDDMVSSLIGTSYQAAHEMANESYTSAAERLRDFGEGLVVMADVYDRTEQANTDASASLGRAV
jgi:enoyl-[acyl-carrier-protein] reductase (NADH)